MIQVITLYRSTIGKKFVMAVTGFVGVGFVIMHMLGNLQVFLGPAKLNAYATFLRSTGELLWLARLTLLGAVVLHIVVAYQLTRISQKSRPTGYRQWHASGSDYASRTMRWSGPILALFIVYHLLDFTFGKVNPSFQEGKVYENVIASFSRWPVSAFYIAAMLALGLHLYHGVWSMFQSLGLNGAEYNLLIRRAALIITLVVVIGNISIPVAVLTGLIS